MATTVPGPCPRETLAMSKTVCGYFQGSSNILKAPKIPRILYSWSQAAAASDQQHSLSPGWHSLCTDGWAVLASTARGLSLLLEGKE